MITFASTGILLVGGKVQGLHRVVLALQGLLGPRQSVLSDALMSGSPCPVRKYTVRAWGLIRRIMACVISFSPAKETVSLALAHRQHNLAVTGDRRTGGQAPDRRSGRRNENRTCPCCSLRSVSSLGGVGEVARR